MRGRVSTSKPIRSWLVLDVRIPLAPPACPRLHILRVNSRANNPSNGSDFSFELWTPDRQSWPIVLRKARFSPKLWTPSIRYGSRNSNVWSYLLTSAESGSATSLGQARASDF